MKTATLSTRRAAAQPINRDLSGQSAPKELKIQKILVAIDFSPSSMAAIEFALPLAKRFGADVHLVHVFEPDYPLASMMAMPLIVPELQVGKRVRRRLKDVAKKYSIELRRENIHVVKGRPFEEVCRLARDGRMDLIVTATRGNTGLKHLALGSTAERIVRYSPCPVLVVRGADQERKANGNGRLPRTINFRKILVPVDFSECSMVGLNYAKSLAKQFQAKIVLHHSLALQYFIASDEYARYDLPLLLQQTDRAARQQMRDLVEKTDWDGIPVESSVAMGHPGEHICAQTETNGADLVVISTHGRTGLRHVLVGSVAEYVVRHAARPVLVVPSHDRSDLAS
jgi:nucleotide-binding universal stress UspA family protein